jgi:hypothetical protein
MKPKKLLILLAVVFSLTAKAQLTIPKGYKKGNVVLTNGTTISGYIKDNISNDASIILLSENTEKKTKYSGLELSLAAIEDSKFLCLKGDFFKIISSGELSLLQKASDISSKPIYNGTEAIFLNNTEGKRGDYFLYSTAQSQLLLLHKKNKEAILALFSGDAASLEIAKQNVANVELIKNAIALYNSRTSRK